MMPLLPLALLPPLALGPIQPPTGPIQPPTGPIQPPTGPIQPPIVQIVNLIANPSFENGLAGWTTSAAYEGPEGVWIPFKGSDTAARFHSGAKSFDFGMPLPGLFAGSTVSQTLAQPIAGSALFAASFWARRNGWAANGAGGHIVVSIGYTAGADTVTGFTLTNGKLGDAPSANWKQCVFSDAIDRSRTVRSISITVYTSWSDGDDFYLDDVSLGILRIR